MPRWHPLAAQASVSLAELRSDAWILPPPETVLREELLEHCRGAGFQPSTVIESADFLVTIGLVLADAGVALATESFRSFAGPDLVLIPINGLDLRLRHYMSYQKDEISPSLAAFLTVAQQHCALPA